VGRDGDRLPGSAQNVVNLTLDYGMEFGNGITLDTVLSGYYQSEVTNSLGDDKCFSSLNTIGNCRDTANPHPSAASGLVYEPDSVFARQFARIDGFSLWNLSANFAKDAWGVSLYVKNIFNEAGTTGAFTFLSGGSNTSPTQNYYGDNSRDYIALPRTFGAMVSYRF
jgi:hypothetical protein